MFGLGEEEKVRRSSISERLSKIDPTYFKAIYEQMYGRFSALYSKTEIEKYNLIRVDSQSLPIPIKYSPDGGTVTIGCREQQDKLLLYVSDEGVGISKKDQQKLFERFYRVDNEELDAISGFGIGLYIVAEILECHNTSIEVESQKGIGTTFKFLLDRLPS